MITNSNENKFVELLSKIPNVAVQGYNKYREVIYWNEASEKIYGYTKEEALGKQLEDLIIPDFMKDDVILFHTNWLEKGEAIPSGELPLEHKNGSTVYVYSSHVMLGEDSDYPEMFCIDIDLTKQKKQEEVLKEKNKLLTQQSRMAQMGEMISMIAHQWRQPLAAISATSASIELKSRLNKLDNDTAQQKAQDRSAFSQHLSKTIDDFRDFFKPNKEKAETSYDELIPSVLEIIGVFIGNKNIELIQELNCHDRFISYPNELKQVILNLIKNAEDALLEKRIENPYIKISTYKENDKYILEVSDNAGGVKEGIMENIFDPYFSTKTKKEGTGLGLYMSKTIIEEHCGGKLTIANNNDGAVFTVELDPRFKVLKADITVEYSQ